MVDCSSFGLNTILKSERKTWEKWLRIYLQEIIPYYLQALFPLTNFVCINISTCFSLELYTFLIIEGSGDKVDLTALTFHFYQNPVFVHLFVLFLSSPSLHPPNWPLKIFPLSCWLTLITLPGGCAHAPIVIGVSFFHKL